MKSTAAIWVALGPCNLLDSTEAPNDLHATDIAHFASFDQFKLVRMHSYQLSFLTFVGYFKLFIFVNTSGISQGFLKMNYYLITFQSFTKLEAICNFLKMFGGFPKTVGK